MECLQRGVAVKNQQIDIRLPETLGTTGSRYK